MSTLLICLANTSVMIRMGLITLIFFLRQVVHAGPFFGFAPFVVFNAMVRAFFDAGWEAEMLESDSDGAVLFLLKTSVTFLPLVMEVEGFILNGDGGLGFV